ncbi:hypothetical protein KR093_003641 [Drosophila rubida]|uniref:Uncharacterized protein n=1 Tax=Drosophila rubida TaxID=30044 RepID=A0AAD4PJB7_9MUSC|nr:hypothetical protein KR093_003641 [Drosophila rubida]
MEYEICRICLNSTVTLVDIFAKREQTDHLNPEPCLADMLNEIAVCCVERDDAFPQHICLSCVLSAQNAWRFKRKCEDGYKQLLTIKEQQEQRRKEHELAAKEDIKPLAQLVDKEQEVSVMLKPYKCQICSKAFADVTILRVHKKWHAEIRSKAQTSLPPVSRKSRKEVKKKSMSKKRSRKNTTAKRPFQCSDCEQGFYSNLPLKRHMRIHTGECPYKCPHCPEAFYRSDYRAAHIKKIHNITDRPPRLKMSKTTK